MRRSMQEVNTQRRVFLLGFSLNVGAAPYVMALQENITYIWKIDRVQIIAIS